MKIVEVISKKTIILSSLVLLIVLTSGYYLGNLIPLKPANSATTPGTCLPIDKGGTGCDGEAMQQLISPLPLANGGTGATSIEGARDNLAVDYSTSEQNTGQKWVDGKTIYSRTYDFGVLPNNTIKNLSNSADSSIDLVIDINAIAAYSADNSFFATIPHAPGIPTFHFGGSMAIRYDKSMGIRIGTTFDATILSAFVTLYYTKL